VIADPDAGHAWIPVDGRRPIRMCAMSLGMTAVSSVGVVTGQSLEVRAGGLLGVLFFGAGAILLLRYGVTARGRGLRLDRDGFAIVGWRRKPRHAWADIANFSIVQVSGSTRVVGFVLEDHVPRTLLIDANRSLAGVDGTLPSALAVRPEALAAALDAWRIRYRERGREKGPAAADGPA